MKKQLRKLRKALRITRMAKNVLQRVSKTIALILQTVFGPCQERDIEHTSPYSFHLDADDAAAVVLKRTNGIPYTWIAF